MKQVPIHPANQPGAVGQKALLRQALLAKRAARPKEVRQANDRALCRQIVNLPVFRSASLLLLYAPIGEEIDISPLASAAASLGIPAALPVCLPSERKLLFRLFTPGEALVPGAYNIPQPPEDNPQATPDATTLCVLPALGYDKDFCRIGYGGGYYDRFLQTFPGKTLGVCYEDCILESVFPEPHDKPVELLVTERRVLRRP